LFNDAVHRHLLPAIDAGAFSGQAAWPPRLRIHRLQGRSEISSMTWSFTGPDGRATFHLTVERQESILVWRRIGNHSIYDQP